MFGMEKVKKRKEGKEKKENKKNQGMDPAEISQIADYGCLRRRRGIADYDVCDERNCGCSIRRTISLIDKSRRPCLVAP